MEVCGTHTVAISSSGLRDIIPKNIKLLSGPGCPVCVTPAGIIDAAIDITKHHNVIFTTFGDMMKVPGSGSSIGKEKAKGADVRVVYSPSDCLKIAGENPDKEIVFMGVGFETTSPLIASVILKAGREQLANFSVISAFKLIPPALKALVSSKKVKIDGFILPGHVSAIIGSRPYRFLKVPSVISGFDAEDILQSIVMLVKQIVSGKPGVQIQYKTAVRENGNPDALMRLDEVFDCADSQWRGIGPIASSGLEIKKKFEKFDALKKFNIKPKNIKEPKGCLCALILQGIKQPPDCRLFAKKCRPDNPVGPCMVSSEGACSARYKYGNH